VKRAVWLGLVMAMSLLVGAGAPAAPGSAGARVALVIGNGAYQHTAHLPNPVHDATDVAAALEKLHYSVQLLTDASKAGMEAALVQFSRTAAGADQVLIYYAGHGIESNGTNYLLPVEATVESENTVRLEAISLPAVMDIASEARHLGLVVLDACRNNPLASNIHRPDGARSVDRGLAAVEPTGNLLVAYATHDGRTAADGTGRNSPYTRAILEVLQEKGLEVDLFFRTVRDRVKEDTHSQQVPVTYGDLGAERIYLNPPDSVPPPPPNDRELALWQSALALRTVEAYRDYLSQYPAGQFSTQAKLQIAALTRSSSNSAAVSAPPPGKPQEPRPVDVLAGGAVFRDCADCPELVMIPAGHFLMGSPDGQGESREHPQHRVDLAAFALGKYDVTFDEWDACVSAHGCSTKPSDEGWGRGRRPVIHVSWDDAQAYVRWLSGKTGHRYRLPSEAEWEYAARAGTTTAYYWGDDFGQGHCAGCGSPYDGKQTAPVGSFPANAFGLHDMAGDVWQWVQDTYHESYTGAPANGRAWEEEGGRARVVRGGSWLDFDGPSVFRPAYRDNDGGANFFLGFRVARTPE
jgi:formylglycine-generating enzyme required for sulfatase activity/uncharacterized caspase-like protein